ncbi:MAG: biotin-dependent carboxyltransferase family protein [Acidimicrobiaceae bacterium]|nr:biotin-dependent carboxyltransferase family protein [Acidimicrobiaceae bacterium]
MNRQPVNRRTTAPDADAAPDPAGAARVERAGALTTVQDDGRPGLAHLGVPRSGALDTAAHHLANRLVGNEEGAAVLETTLDGVSLRLERATTVAVTGAQAAVSVDGAPSDWGLPVHVPAGATVDVGPALSGVRSYLAVAGGLAADRVLGSASTDLLSGLGPAPLVTGDVLRIGAPTAPAPAVDLAPYPPPPHEIELAIRLGPRHDWLSAAGVATLDEGTWSVSTDSNRIALRLSGPPVERSRNDELPSEGLVLGAIQSLPEGELVVFLADHPTTGGYPVVAVVDRASLDACAQARPGSLVRFRRG